MAKDRKKLLHIHSSVNDKQPTPQSIEYGELAVNNAKGNAFISTKNSNDEVVRFSEDDTVINWMEMKEVFPYEGYVRGSDSGSTGVTESDLLQNKSNIIVKINQVAASNSEYDEKINGAKDIYGNLVNPSLDGYRDGAGIAIDMSSYAMIGANPSFSSVTTTFGAHFNGTTVVEGANGSEFNVDVENTTINASESLNESANDIAISATENVCIEGDNTILYGQTKTSIGSNCDGTLVSDLTNVKGGYINVSASDKLCEEGKTSYFYGEDSTNIGINCEGEVSNSVNIVGDTNISGNTIMDGNVSISGDLTVLVDCVGSGQAEPVSVNEALCKIAKDSVISLSSTAYTTSAYSYTDYVLSQVGGINPTGFTVNDTIVAMSAETYPTTSELLKKYTLWQYIGSERKEIGEINIPKDHILKDVSIVNGHLNGDTFTPCPAGDNTCSWYIKLVWNVFDPSTGHADDKITYLPADDFVQDYEFHDSPAIDFTQWYDGQKNHVSADTTIRIMSNDGQTERKYGKANAVHTLSAYTLNSVSGDVKTASGATNWTYDPFDKKVTITAATDASHINRKTVSWTYGDVKSAAGASYDPGDGAVNTFGDTRTMSFVIPQSVDNINRGKLTISHCSTSEEFDPASDKRISLTHGELTWAYEATSGKSGSDSYTACGDKSISIPTDVCHLNRGILSYSHNGFSGSFDPCTDATFEAPHSSLTVTYEATSGKSGSVVYNTSADTSISIPTCVNHLNRHMITFQSGSANTFTNQTYDPGNDCANTTETINIPTCVNHLNRHNITFTSGDVRTFDSQTYDPGNDCTNTTETINIPTSLDHLKEFNGNCYEFNHDICMEGKTIVANGFYSKSDERLKENIQAIMHFDYKKVDDVILKTFNFKDDETKTKTYGVIAQDVLAAGLNEIVHQDEKGLNVDYISLLILKIASLENKVDELSREIANLKK